jgi:hypothetical protein
VIASGELFAGQAGTDQPPATENVANKLDQREADKLVRRGALAGG